MKVYERLAAAFKGEGVTHVFGMMGDGNMHWIDALDQLGGVNVLEVRHEGVGLGMADGWARETRTPGVCTATCGPGVTQLATALVTAARAESPIVAFIGEYPSTDQEYIQSFDQARFAAACEAGFVRVHNPDYVDEAVRKAFYLARLESRPILLSVPMDVQQNAFEDDEPYKPSSTLFSTRITRADAGALEQAADIIAKSKKPVMVLGRGAKWSGAGDAALKLGKRIGALIATSMRAKNWLAENEYHAGISGMYATKTAIQLFEEADCVIAVGASMNRYTTENGYLYPNARYIHLDQKAHVMMGGGRGADCYLRTDAKAGIEDLDRLLEKRSFKSTGYRTGEVLERLSNQYEDRTKFEIERGKMDPREVCRVLDQTVPDNIGLLMGSGASAGFSTMAFQRPRPFVHAAQFFGCIGQMLPAAMGMCAAQGNKPMLLVDGDASTMMHISDFDTAVRYKMPVLTVVLNDQALGSEYQKMVVHKMNAELSAIPTPNIGEIAKSMGGRGALATSVDELRKAAAEWVAKPGPMIIDARISRNAITLAARRVLYGADE